MARSERGDSAPPASTSRSPIASNQPLLVDNLGLVDRAGLDRGWPAPLKPAQKVDPVRTMLVPAVLMFVMFLVIMTSTPQLLNSVIEEKMSKISEVLLGSITPFELMMGKLLGNAGIALLLAALYIGRRLRRRGLSRLCRHRLALIDPGPRSLPDPGHLALWLAFTWPWARRATS